MTHHFLSNLPSDGSFSESFYGLKRVRVQKTSSVQTPEVSSATPSTPTPSISSKPDITTSPITKRNRYLALFFLVCFLMLIFLFLKVVVPYIKAKLDELYREQVPYYNFNILDRSTADNDQTPTVTCILHVSYYVDENSQTEALIIKNIHYHIPLVKRFLRGIFLRVPTSLFVRPHHVLYAIPSLGRCYSAKTHQRRNGKD